MVYTTKSGKDIQVNPILLSDREGWVKCRSLQRIFGEFEQIDDSGSDEWWNKREAMHESFQGLLAHLGVNGKDAISEGDIVSIVSLLQTGELPESFYPCRGVDPGERDRYLSELYWIRQVAVENGLRWQECSLADIWPVICKTAEPTATPQEEIEIAERLVNAGLLGKETMARRSKLDIVVGANVRGALRGLRRVRRSIGGISKTIAKIGGIGGGVGFGGLVGVAIKAAATMEDLQLRMEAVSGSTREAGKRFDETFEFFKRTPLNLKPLIDTRVLLEGVGVFGVKSLKAVSEASVALGRNVMDVAQAVISLETESLRRLGIQFARTADEGVFQFRDKFGKQVEVQRKGIDNLRSTLLKIFSVKFGGFLGKGALTFSGLTSTLGGLITASLAELGAGLLNQAKRFVSFINEKLQSGLESGFFKRMGEKIETAVLDAFDFAKLFSDAGFRADIFENAAKLFVANVKLGMIDIVRLITELDPFRIEALTRFIAQTDFGKKNLPGLGSARTRQFAEAELAAKRGRKEAKDNLGSIISGVFRRNELSDIAAFRFGRSSIGGRLSQLDVAPAGRGRSRNVTERFTFRGGAAIVKLKEGDTLVSVMKELREAILTRDLNPGIVAQ